MARDTFFLLIAIILAIPLSVVANLLTPQLRDWWSRRSKQRLRARILELENDLARPVPPLQELFLGVTRRLGFGLTTLAAQICFVFVVSYIGLTPDKGARAVIIGIIMITYAFMVYQFVDMWDDGRRYLKRLPNSYAQQKIQRRIEQLKKVLEKK